MILLLYLINYSNDIVSLHDRNLPLQFVTNGLRPLEEQVAVQKLTTTVSAGRADDFAKQKSAHTEPRRAHE